MDDADGDEKNAKIFHSWNEAYLKRECPDVKWILQYQYERESSRMTFPIVSNIWAALTE